jgi:hypothetical protein
VGRTSQWRLIGFGSAQSRCVSPDRALGAPGPRRGCLGARPLPSWPGRSLDSRCPGAFHRTALRSTFGRPRMALPGTVEGTLEAVACREPAVSQGEGRGWAVFWPARSSLCWLSALSRSPGAEGVECRDGSIAVVRRGRGHRLRRSADPRGGGPGFSLPWALAFVRERPKGNARRSPDTAVLRTSLGPAHAPPPQIRNHGTSCSFRCVQRNTFGSKQYETNRRVPHRRDRLDGRIRPDRADHPEPDVCSSEGSRCVPRRSDPAHRTGSLRPLRPGFHLLHPANQGRTGLGENRRCRTMPAWRHVRAG